MTASIYYMKKVYSYHLYFKVNIFVLSSKIRNKTKIPLLLLFKIGLEVLTLVIKKKRRENAFKLERGSKN